MIDSQNVLCLETSSPNHGSWALLQGGLILLHRTYTGQTSAALAASLADALPFPAPPTEIRVGVGPGSFSGIRAALALAQGLALGWKAPVVPVRSTHAIATQFPNVSFLGIFSDARRGQLFVTCYALGRMVRPSQIIPRTDLDLWLAKCTTSVSSDGFHPDLPLVVPDAAHLGRPLADYGETETLPPEPIHLRPALAQP